VVRLTLSLPSSSSRRPLLERTDEREGEAERERKRAHLPLLRALFLHLSSIVVMAKVQLVDPVPWGWSTADRQHLESLVASGLLAPNTDPARPLWIAPRSEATPNPPSSYVVSLARLHERGFGVPAGRFIRALCHHCGVELHSFAPNAISQAAVFVAVCEGYLGIPVHWDLWRHLFRGELYTESVSAGVRRLVRAGGLTLQLRGSRKDLYIPCKMTTNNSEWDRG